MYTIIENIINNIATATLTVNFTTLGKIFIPKEMQVNNPIISNIIICKKYGLLFEQSHLMFLPNMVRP